MEKKQSKKPGRLYPRIKLRNIIPSSPRIPHLAVLRTARRKRHSRYIRRQLQYINIHPLRNMPSDMAVERPHPRIRQVDLQHDVAERRHNLRVPALRVGGVGDGAVPLAGALGKDVEVVAVDVHGVGGTVDAFGFDDEADGRVAVHVVELAFGGLAGDIAGLGDESGRMLVTGLERESRKSLQSRVLPIGVVGYVVNVPYKVSG